MAHAIGCSSGTDALWLALAAAGIGPGDAVVTTPFSFFASVSAILRAGATPVLADIDPATFNLDPTAWKRFWNGPQRETGRAILPVHLYGQCADWTAFSRLGQEHGLKLIEDAAQAWGAEWKGVKAGGLGDAAAFSFYPTKNLSAAGDAGMVTTNSAELAERAADAAPARHAPPLLPRRAGLEHAHGRIPGRDSLVKLKYIDGWNQARRAVAGATTRCFTRPGWPRAGPYPTHGVVLPHEVAGSRHVWHQYVIRCARRDALREFLTARKIGSEIYYPVPLHLQDALKSLGYGEGSFPEAERAAREVLALPIFPELREDEQQTVVDAVAEFLS